MNRVMGVGINDLNTNTRSDKCYSKWRDMLRRCYSESYQAKQPTYIGCRVCEEWLTFSNFKAWMLTQDWEGLTLDKDLLEGGNKEYHPDKCVFVSKRLNSSLALNGKTKGLLPIGVTKRHNKFRASCCDGFGRCKKLTPSKYTAIGAHKLWQEFKIEVLNKLIAEQTNPTVVKGIQRIIDKIQHDIDNNLETLNFD